MPPPLDLARLAEIERRFDEMRRAGEIGGLAILLVENGRELFSAARIGLRVSETGPSSSNFTPILLESEFDPARLHGGAKQ